MVSMKNLTIIFIVVIFASIGLGFYGSTITSKKYNWPNTYQVDTVATHDTITIKDTIKADTVKYIPHIFITPASNIIIDSINTVVNGVTTNSDIRISIKDIKNIK